MNQKSNKGIIALLFVGVLMGALDISIVGPAIPSIEHALHFNTRFSGWIFSIYVLFNLTGISLFARLSDVYGRRKIYVLALILFAFGSLLVSIASGFEFLLIGRAVQGFGASGIFPVATALVGDLFSPEKRGRILGLIGAVFGIAFLIGPFVAGVLLHYFSWNVLFIINLPISIVLIYYSLKILPSNPSANIAKIDWGGILTFGIALASFTYGLNNINASQINEVLSDIKVVLPLILSLVSFLLLIFIEKRNQSPIIKLEFFENRQIIIVGIIAIVTGIVQASFVFIPKFVIENFAVSPSNASFMLTPFVLATAVGSPVFGRLIDKFGVKKIVFIGLFLGMLGFFFLSQNGIQKLMFIVSGLLIGLSLSVLAGSSLRYIMLNNTSADDRAVSQGMLTIFISVGQLTGTAVIGFLIGSIAGINSFRAIFISVSIILLAMAILSFGLNSKIQKASE